MLEDDIVRLVEIYLQQEFPVTYREIPLLGRYVDLVGYDPITKRLAMVEAKLTKWRQAVRQARACRLFTDEVFIAMPQDYVHRVGLDILGESGLGLISVGEQISVVLPPCGKSIRSSHYAGTACSLLDALQAQDVESAPS